MLSDEQLDTMKQLLSDPFLPLGLPPPSEDEENKEFLECVLKNTDNFPINNLSRTQKFVPRKMNPENLYHISTKPMHLELEFERNRKTGAIIGFKEVYKSDYGTTAQNSLSMRRRPAPLSEGVRGSASNVPFWPGGLDEPDLQDLAKFDEADFLDFTKDLKTIPPGFSDGMQFRQTTPQNEAVNSHVTSHVISIADLMADGDEFDFEKEEDEKIPEEANQEKCNEAIPIDLSDLEQVLPEAETTEQEPVVKTTKPVPVEESWAVEIDISSPVTDFHHKIPDMARKWPFELDTFQKQAILHVEKGDCVFVAAHTSAGKTVVAEYAIALALKHKTKAVYTSPIKALSNQKFRDFSITFEDVGLITGDVQLKQESSCLIMTTEILRSMLYNGSSVIRDLEWVIFDEVHYINDKERGVVWEEVLIMLPKDVNIILLSATVPNTLDFAGWIGMTKKRKIYVIKTLKRPVPLEHFLYTGNSNKTSKELFQIVNSKRDFIKVGHQKAVDAKKERASKSSQNFGAKGPRYGGNPKQDKNIWLSLLHMLESSERLPVIAFTFSKARIDQNIEHLSSMDLTTSAEKHQIVGFCRRCVSRLKGSDSRLPQVLSMQSLLERGIGKHHSGVLPIMREMVEILFQRGLVKVLFATETFAMGVNMPARTVVFDTIRKHDGTAFRNLQAGEYIQMAGRAGRRGLDKTGQVIILCKGDVPDIAELQIMMLGVPSKLESQFRLTYSMILNLLRVKQLRIEDMIKRSFAEISSRKDARSRETRMKELGERISSLQSVECYLCMEDITNYYETLQSYRKFEKELKEIIYSHPAAVKMLVPGRVIVVQQNGRYALSAVLKTQIPANKERTITCLTLCEAPGNEVEADDKNKTTDQRYRPMKLFHPEGPCGHLLQDVNIWEVAATTRVTLKITPDRIIENCNKRKQERFRDDPPSQSVTTCVQELLRITESNPDGFSDLDPVQDLHIRDYEMVEQFRSMNKLKSLFGSFQCEKCVRFDVHFEHHCKNMAIEDEYREMKFLCSDESLKLLPEYEQRLNVLRTLGYIDHTETIQLKGRVATMISSNEVLITELLTEDVFTPLDPEEMAALLSCVVFEQKNCEDPDVTGRLLEGIERIKAIALHIGKTQRQHDMKQPAQDYVDSLNFGLVRVVYEWARGTPFKEITELTEVQEGIIVRCIQRLNEILLDVRNAARSVGNPTLADRLEIASTMIKRDIVFTASLYITQDTD